MACGRGEEIDDVDFLSHKSQGTRHEQQVASIQAASLRDDAAHQIRKLPVEIVF